MGETSSQKGLSKSSFGFLQYRITGDVAATRKRVFDLLNRIRRKKPHVVVLPEMWLGGPKDRRARARWAGLYRGALDELRAWCVRNRMGVIGSAVERKRGRFFNTAFWVGRDGRVIGKQRKMHLFALEGEAKLYDRGRKVHLFKTPFGEAGCLVCYDLRFPEIAQRLAYQGMKVLVVCAQWPAARRDHWLSLLKARAIENQCFVVAANRLGRKGRINYAGDSVAFDPWGRELSRLSRRETMGIVRIDLGLLRSIRKRYPFLAERRHPR